MDLFLHTEGKLILIEKESNPTSWKHVRPICILPAWLTSLEKIMLPHIRTFIDANLTSTQYGFRKNLHINHAKLHLAYLTHELKCTSLLLIDISQAYDSVDRSILRSYLSDSPETEILNHFLDIYASISYNIANLRINLTKGLPQDSSLFPSLFNIYINKTLSSMEEKCAEALFIAYADDIIIADQEKNHLKKLSLFLKKIS